MKKIQVGDKAAIFLDHRLLINTLYKECTNIAKQNSKTYELKKELFYFHKSARSHDVEKQAEIKDTKRKRKRRGADKTDDAVAEVIKAEQTFLETLLDELKANALIAPIAEIERSPLTRYWEEVQNFPRFHGANKTNEFQSFKMHNCTYLIPPHCSFYNYDISELVTLLPELPKYDLIVIDPPWRNKYIRRIKRVRMELAYKMINNTELQQMLPISQLLHEQSIVVVWCTNSPQHQRALLEEMFPVWNLQLMHTLKWVKLNTSGELIRPLSDTSDARKQPFEMLYVGIHKNTNEKDFNIDLGNFKTLLSIPSIVHSHKPPLLPWLKEFLPEQPKCMEIFARYLQPNFTSIGLEVLKLMDMRLHQQINT